MPARSSCVDALGDVPHAPYYRHCDRHRRGALQAAIAQAREQIGPIAVLVNNAANDVRHALADVDAAGFERNVAVNLRHQVFATQAVVPDMRALGGGSIICLGSTGWMKKNGGYPLYAMAKAAVRGFVNGMARELGHQQHPHQWADPRLGDHREAAHAVAGRGGRGRDRARAVPARLPDGRGPGADGAVPRAPTTAACAPDRISSSTVAGYERSHAALPAMALAVDAGNTLGEGIVWCDRAQALYWTDIPRAILYRWHPASDTLEHWPMPERLASFALCEDDGWLLLALASRLAFFRLLDGHIEPLHEIEPGLATRATMAAAIARGASCSARCTSRTAGAKQPVGGFWRLDARPARWSDCRCPVWRSATRSPSVPMAARCISAIR